MSHHPPPPFSTLIISSFLLPFFATMAASHFPPCHDDFLKLTDPRNLTNCKRLSTLRAELAWRIHSPNTSSSSNSTRFDIMFGTRLTEQVAWVAWGVNPGQTAKMVGTRALIGVVLSNGSMDIAAYNVTRQTKMGCGLNPNPDPLVEYLYPRFEYSQEFGYYVIRATVVMAEAKVEKLNHLWQVGYDAVGMDGIGMHPKTLQHLDSAESLDLVTLESSAFGLHQRYLRTVHGILNMIGWGIFLPTGAIVVRYLRYPFQVDENWWFYPHVTCQVVGYMIGTVGWILGLYLGNASTRYTFTKHRLFSIFLFTFATLQVLAVKLKPRSTDEYKKYWNMYHHFLGYGLLTVIVINMFQGIGILTSDDNTWKWSYIGILVAQAIVVLTLETYTWIRFYNNDNGNNQKKNNDNDDDNNNNLSNSQRSDNHRDIGSSTVKSESKTSIRSPRP